VTRKVILDIDPGIDDAVALTMALFDPRLEVLAVTATAGCVGHERATGNLQSLVNLLDPPRLPRLGVAPADVELTPWPFLLDGSDGLGGLDLPQVSLHGGHVADKVIGETLRAHPRQVTIIALGPLTNLARLFRRDPGIVDAVQELVISGGTLRGAGDATPVADANFFADPSAARQVVGAPVSKVLVPLETSGQLVLGFDLLDQLPAESSRAGALVRRMLPHAYRAQRQLLGSEGIRLHGTVALVAATHPELFERATVAADVETGGELTAGMLVVDRRQARQWQPSADILTVCDAVAVEDCILRGLATAAAAT